jgi:hypothetical protein
VDGMLPISPTVVDVSFEGVHTVASRHQGWRNSGFFKRWLIAVMIGGQLVGAGGGWWGAGLSAGGP